MIHIRNNYTITAKLVYTCILTLSGLQIPLSGVLTLNYLLLLLLLFIVVFICLYYILALLVLLTKQIHNSGSTMKIQEFYFIQSLLSEA